MIAASRKERPVVVGIGEVLWDMLPRGRALGGAPMNAACHAAQMGAASHAVSAVGKDVPGRDIIAELKAKGVDTQYVQGRLYWHTGTVTVALDAAGVPTFTICESVAWDHIWMSDAVRKLAAKADAVVFGSLAQRHGDSRATIHAFLDGTKPSCIRVCDINLRQDYYSADVLQESLQRATVLKVSDTELPVVAKLFKMKGDETAVMRKILKAFAVELVVLTKGEKGSRMMTAETDIAHPGCKAKVVDTVGAGDAFTAVTTMGLLRGMPLENIQEAANRIAAYVCSKPGAVPKLSRKEFGAASSLFRGAA